MCKVIYEKQEIVVDFIFKDKAYLADLMLSLDEPKSNPCSICINISFMPILSSKDGTQKLIDFSINRIRELKKFVYIENSSKEHQQIEQHIRETLLGFRNKIHVCTECLPMLWVILDKR